jgi:RNA polymerase sigma-70 factor (ECF subfamily)
VRGAPLELRPTRANGQPAFGAYLHSRCWGMIVLTLSGDRIAEITFFSDPSLVSRFGLPRRL